MHLQVIFRLLLLSIMLISVKSVQPIFQRSACAECEEEVWEEVPCDEVYNASSSTEAPSTTPSMPQPETTMSSTTPPPMTTQSPIPPESSTTGTPPPRYSPIYKRPYPILSTVSPPIYSNPESTPNPELTDTFKKCYCQCKSGCKEFCRQVVLNPDQKKQITQLSKTVQPTELGHVEFKHSHERNWVPAPQVYNPLPNPVYQQNQIPKPIYTANSPIYNPEPLPTPPGYILPCGAPNYQPRNDIPSYGISNYQPRIDISPYGVPNYQPRNEIPSYGAANYQPRNNVNSLGYSFDDFNRLLNIENSYPNILPGYSQPNQIYPSPQILPNQPKEPPSYNYQTPKYVKSLDAQTSSSGSGIAKAKASSSNNYKSSSSNNGKPAKPYASEPLPPAPSPYAENYASQPYSSNGITEIDSNVENYLKSILYVHPSRTRGYGYPY